MARAVRMGIIAVPLEERVCFFLNSVPFFLNFKMVLITLFYQKTAR
jgi:hypothetical protein